MVMLQNMISEETMEPSNVASIEHMMRCDILLTHDLSLWHS